MPLKLNVSRGEKFIINGAVIRNDGDAASLVFENQAHILRQKDILTPDTAATPSARVYLALQCAYLFPERQAAHLKDTERLLDQFLSAAPSADPIAKDIRDKIAKGELYHGLKACRKLIDYEADLLVNA